MKIYIDSLHSCDKGDISLLLCLDVFSAFDTVNHSLLIQQLEIFFGYFGSYIKLISSFLLNKSFVVSVNNSHSNPYSFSFSVLQGSVLGPLLFSFCSFELPRIISSFTSESTSC